MIEKNQFSKKQWQIITSNEPYKQIIASAGSGKTRTVIGYTVFNLYLSRTTKKILLLTFSRKACGEIKHRIHSEFLPYVEIRTFHSFCYHYLLEYHPEFQKLEKIKIMQDSEKLNFIQEVIFKNPKMTLGIPYIFILKHLEKIKTVLPDLYSIIHQELLNYKKENFVLEFSDLIETLLNGLKNRESWTLPLQENYDIVIVDEFQDTDPTQLEFLKYLRPNNLLVVGDDWQSIYGFRGIKVSLFINFKKEFYKTQIYRLDENYRSLRSIVDISNNIIEYASQKIRKKVKCIRGKGINIPVLSLYPEKHTFYETIIQSIIQFKGILLVRSNHRRKLWENKGIDSQSIMTIHKSKGLEFPLVFIDIIEGWSGESFLTDEEIRIVYVAITRAQNLCVVLHDPEKSPRLEKFLFHTLFLKNTKNIKLAELILYLEKEFHFRNLA